MASGVAGQWGATLNIDGTDVYIDLVDTFHEISIRSHIHQDLPSLFFSFRDKGGDMLNRLNLQDGMTALVSLDDGINTANDTISFLLSGGPQVASDPQGGPFEVQQVGIFNSPDWSKKIWDKTVNGNSSDVISQMAGEAGLTANVDSTNDTQKWLPNQRTMANYARFLADHGYASDDSAILQGVAEDGTVNFKDLNQLMSQGSTAQIGLTDGQIPYHQLMLTSKGKLYNNIRGYGSTSAQDKGTGEIDELNQITTSLLSGFSGIGSAFSNAAGTLGTRIEYRPINSGNVHDNYHKALHNNLRVKGLFSEDVKVLLHDVSGIKLHDTVYFEPRNFATAETLDDYVGDYICTGTLRQVSKSIYSEVITLTTAGTKSEG